MFGAALCLVSAFIIAVVLGSFGIVAFSRTEDPNFGGSSIEFVTGLDSAIQSSISDTTIIVSGCTNESIATSNEVVTGRVIIGHRCPAVGDRQCVASVCASDGLCKEVTVGECSLNEQCASSMGQNYGCDTTSCVCVLRIPVNGSDTTDGLACATGTVEVSNSTCPTAGQILTAVDNQTADWQDPTNPFGVDIVVNGTLAVGHVLVVEVENTTATWKSPSDAGIATVDALETLTNKTFTDPIISSIENGGTLTLPNTTSTLLIEQTATGTATFTGPWASPHTAQFRLSKIGHDVVLWLEAMNVSAASVNSTTMASDEFIPEAFVPISSTVFPFAYVINNIRTWASVSITAAQTMSISFGVIAGTLCVSGTLCGIDQDQIFNWYS